MLVYCCADPPVFVNGWRNVSEDAVANTPVGPPLFANHSGVDVAVTYSIIGGNGSALFKVGLCDGQIRLRASGLLDYNVANVYELEVEAVPNGATESATVANITVHVLYVNKPPVFNDTGLRSVLENQTALTPFGDAVNGTYCGFPHGFRRCHSVFAASLCVCCCCSHGSSTFQRHVQHRECVTWRVGVWN